MMRHDSGMGVYEAAYVTCLASYFLGPSLWTLRLANSLFFFGTYLFFDCACAIEYARQAEKSGVGGDSNPGSDTGPRAFRETWRPPQALRQSP
jgi:hypothetical protein